MTFPAKWVANSILSVHWERGKKTISPLKLQKLLYFLHGWHLAICDQAAVHGGFVAWKYGPVNTETYHAFKEYRHHNILTLATDLTKQGEVAYIVATHVEPFYDVLNMVMAKYGHLSALELSAITHYKDSPWSKTREKGGYHIDDQLIKDHYISLAQTTS